MKHFVMCIILCMYVSSNTYSSGAAASVAAAKTGTVSGIVLDSATMGALPYATVSIVNIANPSVTDGIATNDDGEFLLKGIPFGNYRLMCTFIGYYSKVIEDVSLSAENPVFNLQKLVLAPKYIEGNTLVVKGERDNITYKLDKKILNISENPNVQGGRLTDALQNIPSVSVDMEGKVSIRGSANFQVLIDGKPSPMPGNDALKSIPADAVENVELITNPSAKYDPDGTSGIINIILKKASLNGFNGIINGSAGINDKYNTDALFNYRQGNMNFYAGIGYQDMTFRQTSLFMQERYYNGGDSVHYINPAIDRKMTDKSFSARAGAEFTIDPERFFSISGNYYDNSFRRLYPTESAQWSNIYAERNYFKNEDDYTIDGIYSTINGYYRQQFGQEGHFLSATANAIVWDGGGYEKMSKYTTNQEFEPIGSDNKKHRGDALSRSFMFRGKADYELPLEGSYKLEAGYNFDYTQDFSDYLFLDYNNITGNWDKNSFYTNDTKYFHTINSLYATFSGALWDLSYQLGLRGEYFNRRLDQTANRELYKYEKFNLFPTFHLSANITETQQIQFSYSKRVQRPDVYALNPFPDYADDYVVSVGNPQLMPEFTDSWELNYQLGFEKMFFSLQTYYKATDNAMTRVLKVKEDGKLWITSENVESNYIAGAELAANITVFKGLRVNLNGSLYRFEIDNGSALAGEYSSGNVFDGNIMVFYSITPTTLLQLNGFYIGQKITTDGKIDDTYSAGFSLRQFLLDRKLTIYLNGRNVLSTVKYKSVNRRPEYYAYGTLEPEGANISLGFSLNINNYEQKLRPEDTIERSNAGSSGGY